MTIEVSSDGEVVFPKERWKSIPGYLEYIASETGKIMKISTNHILKQREHKTSVGSYLDVSVIPDGEVKFKSVGAHVLVCLAFHGLPPDDGKRYEVNHKDGNKHHNWEANVEWMTRRDNIIHACVTGLRKNCNRVIAKNVINGEIAWYYSVVDFARKTDITRAEAYRLLREHKTIPYMGQWIYRLDLSARVVSKHPNVKDILALDHVTGKYIVASDAFALQEITGVRQQTINAALRLGRKNDIAGYSFKYLDDDSEFAKLVPSVAERNRDEYRNKPTPKKKRKGIVVIDYTRTHQEGRQCEFENAKATAEHYGISRGTIMYLINQPEPKLFKGKVFRYYDDHGVQLNPSPLEVELSVRAEKNGASPITVVDLISNTTKHYPSIGMFAKENNLNPSIVTGWMKTNGDKPYKKRWSIRQLIFNT